MLVNGAPTQEFKCFRGLRQGDPVSPFLFIIAMEALSGVMRKACEIGLFKGIRCGNNGPSLSHLLYADDVVFVGEWDSLNAQNLNRILRCFYLASGLRVNLAKSSVFGVGVDGIEVENMAGILRCKAGSFPCIHLGLQVGANMNLIKHWNPVVDIFRKRLANWKANMVSYGGKITLIKAVLNALPTYYFSLYRAPIGVIDQLERIRREFLWGSDGENGKINWVAWQKVMAPIDRGGLGIGSLRDANLAMLAKWWWRYKSEINTLWRKVISSIHHSSRSWQFIPRKTTVTGVWKQIGNMAHEVGECGLDLEALFKCVPGEGRDISFWKDRWLDNIPLCRSLPQLFELEQVKNVTLKDRITTIDGRVGIWLQWVRCPASADELEQLETLISDLMLFNIESEDDRVVWDLEADGFFTVKSIKKELERRRAVNDGHSFSWNNLVPIKVNFLLWRVLLGRLATMTELVKRNVNLGSLCCKLCGEADESLEHLLVRCSVAQGVWEFIASWCRLPMRLDMEVKDVVDFGAHVRGCARWRKLINGIMRVGVWCIWNCRNEAVFKQKKRSIEEIKEEIKHLGFIWLKNRSKAQSLTWSQWCDFDVSSMF